MKCWTDPTSREQYVCLFLTVVAAIVVAKLITRVI